MSTTRAEILEMAVGFVVVTALASVVYWGGTRAIRLIVPPTETEDVAVSIAVAAYFEGKAETTPQLRVAGTVLENGKPLPEGRARVTVRRLNDASQQGISVVITNGRFETGDQAAFSGYSRRDRLTVETEVSKPDVALLGRHETYLNAFPPLRPGSIQAVLVGLGITAVVFFWAFTGSATPGKNQGAIIFSYCVMILFLALPFMAFYVLGRYQSVAQAAMDVAWTTPVGVLPAVPVHDSDGRPATGVDREWVLNIGGIVIDRSLQAPAPKTSTDKPATDTASGGASGQEAPPASPAATDGSDVIVPDYAIEGGLVIPLYVLVLSIIGGAINMTRMLPVFQREAQSLVTPKQWIQTVGGELLRRTGLGPATTVVTEVAHDTGAETPGAIADDTETAGTTAGTNVRVVTGKTDGEPGQPKVEVTVAQPATATAVQARASEQPVPPSSAEDTTPATPGATTVTVTPTAPRLTPAELGAAWRQGLVTQHMYLISAPFLAIAVFYLLDWLDLRKKALLVLASFSVGLVSDKILGAILSVVEPVLHAKDGADGTSVQVKSDSGSGAVKGT